MDYRDIPATHEYDAITAVPILLCFFFFKDHITLPNIDMDEALLRRWR